VPDAVEVAEGPGCLVLPAWPPPPADEQPSVAAATAQAVHAARKASLRDKDRVRHGSSSGTLTHRPYVRRSQQVIAPFG